MSDTKPKITQRGMISGIFITQGSMVVVAYFVGRSLDVDPFGDFAVTPVAILLGIVAALIQIVAMMALRHALPGFFEPLERKLVEFFREGGVRFSWPIIMFVGLAAGIGEEIFFRGLAQNWLAEGWGIVLALLASNLLFALMHPHSLGYMALVFPIGVYLGLVYLMSGNILVPIMAHALYDHFALWRIGRMIRDADAHDAVASNASGEVEADR